MINYENLDIDVLRDIETYASQAIGDIADLQDRLRENARRIGGKYGEFLLNACDALDAVVHDELSPDLQMARAALESGTPQAIHRAGQIAYAREILRDWRVEE